MELKKFMIFEIYELRSESIPIINIIFKFHKLKNNSDI